MDEEAEGGDAAGVAIGNGEPLIILEASASCLARTFNLSAIYGAFSISSPESEEGPAAATTTTTSHNSLNRSTAPVKIPCSACNGARRRGRPGTSASVRGGSVRSRRLMAPRTSRVPTRVTWPLMVSWRGVVRTRVLPESTGARSAYESSSPWRSWWSVPRREVVRSQVSSKACCFEVVSVGVDVGVGCCV